MSRYACIIDNMTNNHPILAGMIVLAHLKETVDYYKRLEVAEISNLFKAVLSKGKKKIEAVYRKLFEVQALLDKANMDQ